VEFFGPLGIVVIIVVIYALSSIKILAEYERAVIFRLGRLLAEPKGPGVILVLAPFDRMVRVSLRQEAMKFRRRTSSTRDNVTLKVNAVIFLRAIERVKPSTKSRTTSTRLAVRADHAPLRARRGRTRRTPAHREKINLRLQTILDQHTAPWGGR